MKRGTVHEPEAELLTAEDAVEDGRRLIELLKKKEAEEQLAQSRPSLSSVLAAIDDLPKRDLLILKQRVDARLAK